MGHRSRARTRARTRAARPASPSGPSGAPGSAAGTPGATPGTPGSAAGPPGSTAGSRGATPGSPGPAASAAGRRLLRLLNPRRTPTRSRVRNAAALFALLSLLLVVLGLAANRAFFQPALLTAILALLWGARAATMR